MKTKKIITVLLLGSSIMFANDIIDDNFNKETLTIKNSNINYELKNIKKRIDMNLNQLNIKLNKIKLNI